MKVLNLS